MLYNSNITIFQQVVLKFENLEGNPRTKIHVWKYRNRSEFIINMISYAKIYLSVHPMVKFGFKQG